VNGKGRKLQPKNTERCLKDEFLVLICNFFSIFIFLGTLNVNEWSSSISEQGNNAIHKYSHENLKFIKRNIKRKLKYFSILNTTFLLC